MVAVEAAIILLLMLLLRFHEKGVRFDFFGKIKDLRWCQIGVIYVREYMDMYESTSQSKKAGH